MSLELPSHWLWGSREGEPLPPRPLSAPPSLRTPVPSLLEGGAWGQLGPASGGVWL